MGWIYDEILHSSSKEVITSLLFNMDALETMLREEADCRMRQQKYNPVLVGNTFGTINRKPNHSGLIKEELIFLTLKSQTIQSWCSCLGICTRRALLSVWLPFMASRYLVAAPYLC